MLERSYQAYVTDCMKILLENTAVPAAYCSKNQEGKAVTVRWVEAIDPKPKKQKSAGEIVAGVVKSGGLVPVITRKE